MPALNVFGRRWLVAGDDMPLISSFAAIFHLVSKRGDGDGSVVFQLYLVDRLT